METGQGVQQLWGEESPAGTVSRVGCGGLRLSQQCLFSFILRMKWM